MSEGMISLPKSISEYAILPTAGQYGTSLTFEADVELAEFEYNPDPESSNYPAWDTKKEGHYAYFRFEVVGGPGSPIEGKKVRVRHHEPIDDQSGSKLFDILGTIGVDLHEDDDGGVTFDPSQVAPRKVTGIEVGDPRESKGRKYTGNLVGVKVIG